MQSPEILQRAKRLQQALEGGTTLLLKIFQMYPQATLQYVKDVTDIGDSVSAIMQHGPHDGRHLAF